MMRLFPVAAMIGALTACAAPRTQAVAGDAAASITDTVPVITLERGACRGMCPIYGVALFTDGRVQFRGERFVTPVGNDTGRTTAANVQSAQRAFEAARFTTLPSRIDMASDHCGAYVADVPTVELSLRGSSGTHAVQYDQGCRNYPRVLDTLAHLVDSISGTSRWTATRGK